MTPKKMLDQALSCLHNGSMMQAMKIFYDLHELNPDDIFVLEKLVEITRRLKATDQCIIVLQKLIRLAPTRHVYYDQIAFIYAQESDWLSACMTYQALLVNRPKFAPAHYNLAYYMKKNAQFQEAIASYERALKLNIQQPEEVHLNIAVIYADHLRQEQQAELHLENALKINSEYVPALYNLANLFENRGDKDKTLSTFEKILALEPQHVKVLSRILQLSKQTSSDNKHLLNLEAAVKTSGVQLGDQIDAYYALGKAYGDRQEYSLSFRNYLQANKLNAMEMPRYSRDTCEAYFSDIIKSSAKRSPKADCNDTPIFICGLFRTGSTLIEQILASHTKIKAGGERDFFANKVYTEDFHFPQVLNDLAKRDLETLAVEYSAETQELYGSDLLVTDKRPDNFVYLALIKRVFPKAKIIFTTRDSIDNCLSIYFTRLSGQFDYSINLEDIAHYYKQHMRLLEHWKSVFAEDLFVLHYDDLINEPEKWVRDTLNFLNLEWEEECMNFHKLKNEVKTASVWQVRQPLYKTSSGRWNNYINEPDVKKMIKHFGKN